MGITFKVKGADEAKAAETKKAVVPEATPEAVSKQKLGGKPTKKAVANVEVTKTDNKTKKTEVIEQGPEETSIDVAEGSSSGPQKAVVGYSFGFTHNPGNFQSYRANVWLSMPLDDPSELAEGFALVKGWVDERVQVIYEELTKEEE